MGRRLVHLGGYLAGLRGIDPGAPVTAGLVGELPGVRVTAISLMLPGCTLPPHRHPELANHYATYHLGLTGGIGAGLWTEAGGFMAETPGRGFVFDGSEMHYVFNCSKLERMVLYIEFDKRLMAG